MRNLELQVKLHPEDNNYVIIKVYDNGTRCRSEVRLLGDAAEYIQAARDFIEERQAAYEQLEALLEL